jgi:hypothetical protein
VLGVILWWNSRYCSVAVALLLSWVVASYFLYTDTQLTLHVLANPPR